MPNQKVKEAFEKQLQLLSERSTKEAEDTFALCSLTEAMVKLVSAPWPSCE